MTDAKDHAIIKAEYAEYRPVKTRGVLQIICEVPREQAQMVHRTFGEPGLPNQQIWVAIAKLNPETGKAKEAPKPKRDKLLSEQAAIRCKSKDFQKYFGALDAEHANIMLKRLLNIKSKTELDTDADKAEQWKTIESGFQNCLAEQKWRENLDRERAIEAARKDA